MEYDNLFKNYPNEEIKTPLAEMLRPKSFSEFYGQSNILGEHSLLRKAIVNDNLGNTIFSGPPGVGKTTLVEIISNHTRADLIKLNAILSGIKDLREEICLAEERLSKSKRKTILFIDEVHRFTAAQQDALLPSIENGIITFVGATTENPFFSVNKALLSRSRIFKLLPLEACDLKKIIKKVTDYYANLSIPKNIEITGEAMNHLIKYSSGDERNLINSLELAINSTPIDQSEIVKITNHNKGDKEDYRKWPKNSLNAMIF